MSWICDKCKWKNWQAVTVCCHCAKIRSGIDDIQFECMQCEGSLIVSVEGAGLAVDCPHCWVRINIPTIQELQEKELQRIKRLSIGEVIQDKILLIDEAIERSRELPKWIWQKDKVIKNYITITLGPGEIRYIELHHLLNRQMMDIILEEIHSLSKSPWFTLTLNFVGSHETHIESFLQGKSFDEQIRIVVEYFEAYTKNPFPSEAHASFVSYLQLKTLCLDEFWASWVPSANSKDLIDSYRDSPNHIILKSYSSDRYVFKRTTFFRQRRETVEKGRRQQEQERLRRAERRRQLGL